MEWLEKITFVLAVIAIVLVAAFVGVFSFVIQKSSGISENEANAALEMDSWLGEARRIASGQTGPVNNVLLPAGPVGGSGGVAVGPNGQPAPGSSAPAAKPAAPGQPDNYIARENEAIPPQEQVPGVPWLRRQEGVTYMKPESVPDVVYQRYQGFEEAWNAAQEGAGEFVNGNYRVNWVNPSSLLASKVGLRDGDEIISVNGRPVGGSFTAGRQLYDSLKGEKRFAVKVRRNGQEVVLSFFVN